MVGGHATVGRLSNNVFWTFQAIWETFLKKVTERSRDSGRRSRDRRMTVKQRFLDVSSNYEQFFEKSPSLNGHATVVGGHATVPDDCQTTFFKRFKQFGQILKKGRSHDSGRRSRDCWEIFNNVDVSSNAEKFMKKVAECRSRDSG